jgi:biotin carboxyl carrier protein
MSGGRLILKHSEGEHAVEVLDREQVRVDGTVVRIREAGAGEVRGDAGGVAWTAAEGDLRWVYYDGCVHTFEVQERSRRTGGRRHHGALAAPMPATVRQINVREGDAVRRGDTLILLEAMKMELPVRAGADGTVTSINCRTGDLVQPGVTLLEIDET